MTSLLQQVKKGCWVQHPVWEEAFDVWQAHADGGWLEVQLWDDDRAAADDVIATVVLPVASIFPPALEDGAAAIADSAASQDETPVAPRNVFRPQAGAAAVAPRAERAPGPNGAVAATRRGALPTDKVVVQTRVIDIDPTGQEWAKRVQGLPPRLHLRLTWLPDTVQAPWGAERASSPRKPWRKTELAARHAVTEAGVPPRLSWTTTVSKTSFSQTLSLIHI